MNNTVFCTKCGAVQNADAAFCTKCGAPIAKSAADNGYTPYGNPASAGPSAPFSGIAANPNISRSEFVKKYATPDVRKNILAAGIMGYICAGVTAATALAFNPIGLIDALVFLGLMLGVHLGKNLPCAIISLVVAAFEVIVGIVLTGQVTGVLWIAAGIYAVVGTSKASKQYKAFKASAGQVNSSSINFGNLNNDFR